MRLRSGKLINTELPVFRPRIRRPSYRSQSSTSSQSLASIVPVTIDICDSPSILCGECSFLNLQQQQQPTQTWILHADTTTIAKAMPCLARVLQYNSYMFASIRNKTVKEAMCSNNGLRVLRIAINVINCKLNSLSDRIEVTIEFMRILYWILTEKPCEIDTTLNFLNRISRSQAFYDTLKRKGETTDEWDTLFPPCIMVDEYREQAQRLRDIYDLVMSNFDPCVYDGKGIQDMDNDNY